MRICRGGGATPESALKMLFHWPSMVVEFQTPPKITSSGGNDADETHTSAEFTVAVLGVITAFCADNVAKPEIS